MQILVTIVILFFYIFVTFQRWTYIKFNMRFDNRCSHGKTSHWLQVRTIFLHCNSPKSSFGVTVLQRRQVLSIERSHWVGISSLLIGMLMFRFFYFFSCCFSRLSSLSRCIDSSLAARAKALKVAGSESLVILISMRLDWSEWGLDLGGRSDRTLGSYFLL